MKFLERARWLRRDAVRAQEHFDAGWDCEHAEADEIYAPVDVLREWDFLACHAAAIIRLMEELDAQLRVTQTQSSLREAFDALQTKCDDGSQNTNEFRCPCCGTVYADSRGLSEYACEDCGYLGPMDEQQS